MRKFSVFTGIGLFIGLAAASPARALDHTYVKLNGSDGSACNDGANACATLGGALTKTNTGGTIQCVDASAESTPFTIDKSITIDCIDSNHVVTGAGNVITINAPGGTVNLRGLTVRGNAGATIGINVVSAAAVIIQDSAVTDIVSSPALGIKYAPSVAGSQLFITDTIVVNNGISPSTGGGILIAPAANVGVVLNNLKLNFNVTAMVLNTSGGGGIGAIMRQGLVSSSRSNGILALSGNPLSFSVETSSLTNNVGSAIQATGANTAVKISDTVITNNQTGVSVVSGGVAQSFKNNRIFGNGTDGTPLPQAVLQ